MDDYSTLAAKRDGLLVTLRKAQGLRNRVVEEMVRRQLQQVRDQIKQVVKSQQNLPR